MEECALDRRHGGAREADGNDLATVTFAASEQLALSTAAWMWRNLHFLLQLAAVRAAAMAGTCPARWLVHLTTSSCRGSSSSSKAMRRTDAGAGLAGVSSGRAGRGAA